MSETGRPSQIKPGTPSGPAGLFRPGAGDYRTFADVSVVAPASLGVAVVVMSLIAAALIAAAFIIRVPDSLSATGVLMPAGGFVDVTAPAAGIVSALHVRPGKSVVAGSALVELRRDRAAPGEPSLAAQAERTFGVQSRLLADMTSRLEDRLTGQVARLDARVAALRRQADSRREQARLLAATAESLKARHARLVSLGKAGGVARDDIERARREWLGARAAQLSAEADVESLESEVSLVLGNRKELIAEAAISGLEHSMRRYDIALVRAEAVTSGSRSVSAPVAGRVLHVHRALGDNVDAGARLVSLLPPGRGLEVWLYIGAADAAGLERGKTIRVRAAALPENRYGSFPATVLAVSRVSIGPGETPVSLGVRSPVFEVRAGIDDESDRVLLESLLPGFGTAFDASVIRRSPRLIDWIFRAMRPGAGDG